MENEKREYTEEEIEEVVEKEVEKRLNEKRFKIKELKKYKKELQINEAAARIASFLIGVFNLCTIFFAVYSFEMYHTLRNALSFENIIDFSLVLAWVVVSELTTICLTDVKREYIKKEEELNNKINEIKSSIEDFYIDEIEEEESKGRGR